MKQRPRLLPLLTLTLGAGLLVNPSSAQAASSQVVQSTPHFFWAQGRDVGDSAIQFAIKH